MTVGKLDSGGDHVSENDANTRGSAFTPVTLKVTDETLVRGGDGGVTTTAGGLETMTIVMERPCT